MSERENTVQLYWVMYFSLIHVLGAAGFWYAFAYADSTLIWVAVVYFFLSHLSITIAAHRCYTHDALRMHPALAYVFMLLFSATAQGSIIWWVGTHRKHHAYEDVPGKDPHSPVDGFFHAHMGWLLRSGAWKASLEQYTKSLNKPDINNRPAQWQHRYHAKLTILMAFIVPTLLGATLGDFVGGFLLIGVLRLCVQYHATWVVNSVGHTFGEPRGGRATNFGWWLYTPVAAIVTVGEAWHANHHVAQSHWRLGRTWWQIDIGTYVIWLLARVRLIHSLKESKTV
jgi:stearoyl-CoA desaturase (Delta-9 desaturase)